MTTLYDHADAIVVDVRDPEKRGRVKVRCAALYGPDQVIDEWIEPEWVGPSGNGHGAFFVPDVGDTVRLYFAAESSHDEYKWEGFNRNPQFSYRPSPQPSSFPSEFGGGDYLKNDGFKSSGGAVLALGKKKSFAGIAAEDTRLGSLDASQQAVRGNECAALLDSIIAQLNVVIDAVIATLPPPHPSPPHPSFASLAAAKVTLATLSPSGTLSSVVKLE